MVADGVRVAVSARDRLPPERICTIYNGVDTARFAPPADAERQAAREHLGLGPDDAVVGMVAGFRAEKNHDVFFAGAERALAAVPSLKVLAVGGGELLESYRQSHRRLKAGAAYAFRRRNHRCAPVAVGHGRRLSDPGLQ